MVTEAKILVFYASCSLFFQEDWTCVTEKYLTLSDPVVMPQSTMWFINPGWNTSMEYFVMAQTCLDASLVGIYSFSQVCARLERVSPYYLNLDHWQLSSHSSSGKILRVIIRRDDNILKFLSVAYPKT